MSSIAFHEQDRTTRVSGRERAMMGQLCYRMLLTQLGHRGDYREWVPYVIAPDHYLAAMARDTDTFEGISRFNSSVETHFNVGDNMYLDGKPLCLFSLQLNSVIHWGSDRMHLIAKLHGQCEIHAYCEEANRAWLADLIDEAVDDNLLRPDAWGYDGWPAVSAMLRDGKGPVVTSYSVCDSFPSPSLDPALEGHDDPWEVWDEKTEAEQWEIGMAQLRKEPGLEISPERLGHRFGHNLSGYDLIKRAYAMKEAVAA